MSFVMKGRHAAVLLSSLVLAVGCSAYDDSRPNVSVQDDGVDPQARNCPPEGCPLPEDPSDPDTPPKPPVPPQPDPSRVRIIDIPATFIESGLTFALAGTVVQATHTSGEDLSFPGTVHTCHGEPNSDPAECLAECNEVPVKQRAQCRAQCNTTQICTYFCSNTATSTKNFIRWGDAAKALAGTQACSPTTCPTCPTATTISSLENEDLTVPIFQRSYGPPGLEYTITCRMNQFKFTGSLTSSTVVSAPDGVRVRFNGSTGSPSVICSGAPDVTVHDPAVQLRFSFPTYSVNNIVVDAGLLGDVDSGAGPILDYVADVEDRIKSKFREVAGNRLNKAKYAPIYKELFLKMIGRFITVNNLSPVAIPGRIEPRNGSIHFQYWTN